MIEFITKAPSSSKVSLQGFRKPTIKLNTTNNNINFSKDIIAKLKGENEEFRFGFGYDREKSIVVLYTTPEGLKPSASGTISAKHHRDDIMKTLGLEEHEGKVIVFQIDLENPIVHKDENVDSLNIYPLTFSEVTEPRKRKGQEVKEEVQNTTVETPLDKAPVEESQEEVAETTVENTVDVAAIKAEEEAQARKAAIEAADAANQEALPAETTVAETEGENPTQVQDLGQMPTAPGAPIEQPTQQGFKWPGQK